MISYNKYVNKKGQLIDKKEIYANGKPALKKLKATLQTQLKSYSGTWCVYVKNLDTNEYMLINNRAMTTASIIKLFNMGAVYDRIEKKKLTANSDINSNLQSMITVSSNDAYNVLLNRLGNGNTLSGISIVNQFCKKMVTPILFVAEPYFHPTFHNVTPAGDKSQHEIVDIF